MAGRRRELAWMLTATGLVMLMTPGLSFFYGGMVLRKNVISTMLRSIVALAVVSLLWVVVGFSLAFGDSFHGLIGNPTSFFMMRGVGGETHAALSPTIPLLLFALFQLKFAIITPALITGSFAERTRFSSYVIFMVAFSLFIFSPLAHWTWHPDGFLHRSGVLDFAGGTVVHLSAGVAALVGARALGRRHTHIAGHAHVPANIPFVMLGTGMLWFGWFGFNAGSALAANATAVSAVLTTNTAAAVASLVWILTDYARGRRPSALGACIGAVVGLVAITPAAGYVDVGASIVIGAMGAAVSNLVVHWKNQTTIDDTLDVFPCHGVDGLVGMILTAVFAQEGGAIHGSLHLLGVHLLGLLIVLAFTGVGSYVLYRLVDALQPFRVSAEEEAMGLDLSQHDESIEAATAAPKENGAPVAPGRGKETKLGEQST
ncbi:MAG: ammonium transporter [Myxococcales bacterium]|nr:ammonium transporter [Myxococcales bacterium]